MSREVIIKVLDDEELKPQFSQDGNVYRATLPSPYENMGQLIRCKDCKHYDSEHEVCCVYISYRFAKNADDYCSDAERKEE